MPKTGDAYQAVDATGRSTAVTLARQVSDSSGEGEIWRTSRPRELAKIYKSSDVERVAKLEVMLRHPPSDPAAPDVSIAWPTALLKKNGRGEGFTMPEIANAKRPVILYVPKTRRKDAPGIDWFSMHVAALNVATVCRSVHERGYLIGDLKAENWLIDQNMRAVIIDTDSFQIRDPATGRLYRCPVATPDYTPRELVGRSSTTIEQDYFAMGVLIYLFLFGRHPFSGGAWKGRGQAPSETSERIVKGQWLWQSRGDFQSRPTDIPIDTLAPELVSLMRRCFDNGHNDPKRRPTSTEWVGGLEAALDGLTWCNRGTMHVYSGHRPQCPWCELSKATGYDPYPTQPNIRSRSFDVATGRLRQAHQNDLVRALRMIDRNPRLAKEKDLAAVIADVTSARPYVKAIDDFRREFAKPANERDDLALIARIEKDAKLADFLRKSGAIEADLDRLDELRVAVQAMDAAIAASPASGKTYALAGERAIVAVLDKEKNVLMPNETAKRRFGPRASDARVRVRAYDLLTKALSDGDDDTLASIQEEYQGSLASLTEAKPLEAEVEMRARRARTIRRFIKEAERGSADDAELVMLWESVPGLAESQLARKAVPALANSTPLQRYERARRRSDQSHIVASTIKDRDSRSNRRIVEAYERDILTAWRDAEKVAGSLAAVLGGRLATRVALAETRLAALGELRRLASQPRQNDCELAQYWRTIDDRSQYDLDKGLLARCEQADREERLLAAFLALATGANPDEAAIAAYADRHPNLASLPIAAGVVVNDGSITDRMETARRRLEGLASMRLLIARIDSKRNTTEADEQSIRDGWRDRAVLLAPWRPAREEIEGRLELAYARMERSKALHRAAADRDQAGALAAWGSDGALNDYEPAQSHRAFVEEATAVAKALRPLESKLTANDGDDEGTLELARHVVKSLDTPYASAPLPSLNGATIRASVAQIDRRREFIDALERAGDDLASKLEIASRWSREFGRDHPRLRPLLGRLNDCLAVAELLDKIETALRSGDDATVSSLWSNEKLAELDVGTMERVRAALQRHLDAGHPFIELALGALTRLDARRLRLTWDWEPARMPGATYAQVLVSERQEPEVDGAASSNVHMVRPQPHPSRGNGKMLMGRIDIEFSGRRLLASVRPAIMTGDTLVAGRQGLLIKEAPRVIQYEVRSNLGGLGGGLLEIRCDRPGVLPALSLINEGNGREVRRIEETATGEDGRLVVQIDSTTSLLQRFRAKSRKPLELVLANQQRDSDWSYRRYLVTA